MDQHFDTTVAQAVFTTKVLERALHETGPWTLSWGPFEVPAERTIVEGGVTFRAEFPEWCHLEPPMPVGIFKVNGEIVAAKTIEFPGDGAFVVEWTLRTKVIEQVG